MKEEIVIEKKRKKKMIQREPVVVIKIPLQGKYEEKSGTKKPEEIKETEGLKPDEAVKKIEVSLVSQVFYDPKEISSEVIMSEITFPERDVKSLVTLIRYQPLTIRKVDIEKTSTGLFLPERSVGEVLRRMLSKLPELEFKSSEEIVRIEMDTSLPKIEKISSEILKFVFMPKVGFLCISDIDNKRLVAECHAKTVGEIGELKPEGDYEETLFDPLEKIFGTSGFKQTLERPVVLLAEKPEDDRFDYLEYLKRVLREIYRTRSKGIPSPTHLSTEFDEVKLEVKAGRSIYAINVDELKDIKNNELKYLEDRLKELYSQNFGFLVLYGSKQKLDEIRKLWNLKVFIDKEKYVFFSRIPKFMEIHIRRSEDVFVFANLMWGRVEGASEAGEASLDEYVTYLEDNFYGKIERIAGDLRTALTVEPSKEDEEGIEGESVVHYGVKAFAVMHFIKNGKIPPTNVITEHGVGDIVVDVYVRHPKSGDIAVEIETLYGTALPLLKLRKSIESRLKKGLKVWIVIPNPQFMIYFREISALRTVYRKKYPGAIEFYTLDIFSNRLISFEELNKLIETYT
ncbi:MAG: hypothetical protein J7L07_00055 [Candidatus Odinarchaeota archaeon]|nr:hypothetical protein [Candidatus Odinarchaeota archaeon]